MALQPPLWRLWLLRVSSHSPPNPRSLGTVEVLLVVVPSLCWAGTPCPCSLGGPCELCHQPVWGKGAMCKGLGQDEVFLWAQALGPLIWRHWSALLHSPLPSLWWAWSSVLHPLSLACGPGCSFLWGQHRLSSRWLRSLLVGWGSSTLPSSVFGPGSYSCTSSAFPLARMSLI